MMNFTAQLSGKFNTIAEFIISPLFVWIWCAFILIYAMRYLSLLKWHKFSINSQLKDFSKTIGKLNNKHEFAAQYTELDKKFKASKILNRPWSEFTKHITFSMSPDRKERILVQANKDVADFFHHDSTIGPWIDARFYSSIPTHLSGLGILGTFCGLSSGIYLARFGLAGGQMDEIQNSLVQLLNGASLAFWTSITGILTSIIFTRFERGTIKHLQKQVNNFAFNLQDKIAFRTPVQTAQKQIEISYQTNQLLEKVVTSLDSIYQERAGTNEKILKEMVKEFKNTMIVAAGEEVKYIATAFKQINLALNETRHSLDQSGKHLLSSMEVGDKIFKKNLHEVSHQFQANFHKTNEVIQNTFRESTKDISHTLNISAQAMGDAIKKPAQELAEKLTHLDQGISQSTLKWVSATEKATDLNLKAVASHKKLVEFIDPLVNAAHSIAKACEEAQASLSKSSTAAEKTSEAVRKLEQISIQTKGTWDSYCKRFEAVDQSLGQAFQQTNHSIIQYSEKIRSFTAELDQNLSRGMHILATAVGELKQVVDQNAQAQSLQQAQAANAMANKTTATSN